MGGKKRLEQKDKKYESGDERILGSGCRHDKVVKNQIKETIGEEGLETLRKAAAEERLVEVIGSLAGKEV